MSLHLPTQPSSARGGESLSQKDLSAFNYWLSVTRCRSALAIVLFVLVLHWIGDLSLRVVPIVIICFAEMAISPLYFLWQLSGKAQRLLTYTQLSLDILAITCGLHFVGSQRSLFHFLYVLVVVPASLISVNCGLSMATLSTLGHLALLSRMDTPGIIPISAETLVPVFTFYLVAHQSVFYGHHVEEKNRDLAATAQQLQQTNSQLEEEAAISAVLLQAARTLSASLNPTEILERINGVAQNALECDWSATLLLDSERKSFRISALTGTEPEILDQIRNIPFPLDSFPLFQEAMEREVIEVDSPESPLFPVILGERWHISSFLCAPLTRGGQVIGLLAAGYSGRTGPFSPRALRLIKGIAYQAAAALDNARLFEDLRNANRVKSEFIGTMSHELRSPLSVVIGYTDLLLEKEMGELSNQQAETLIRIRHYSLQLLDLIQAVLDLNRLESGRLPLNTEEGNISEFMQQLRASIPQPWQKEGVGLEWSVPAGLPPMRTDWAKLKMILRNLIHNALKFTDRGRVRVEAATSSNGEHLEFTVADTGIGVEPKALSVIFEKFRQLDGSDSRRHGGVGLGLYIVKCLVEVLGGEIGVTSQIGQGSVFRVRLRAVDTLPLPSPSSGERTTTQALGQATGN